MGYQEAPIEIPEDLQAMPTYDYQCGKCGIEFEREQRITEPPVKTCPKCKGRKVKRLLSAPGFILKGGGWYADGYGSKSKKSSGGGESGGSSDSSSSSASSSTSSSASSPATPSSAPSSPSPAPSPAPSPSPSTPSKGDGSKSSASAA